MKELDLTELVKLGEKAGKKDFGEFHGELLRRFREGEEFTNQIFLFESEIKFAELGLRRGVETEYFIAGVTLGLWKGFARFAEKYYAKNPNLVLSVASSPAFVVDENSLGALERMEKLYGDKFNPFAQIPRKDFVSQVA